jgi:hypothetical protein
MIQRLRAVIGVWVRVKRGVLKEIARRLLAFTGEPLNIGLV